MERTKKPAPNGGDHPRPRVGLLIGSFEPVTLADLASAMAMLDQCDLAVIMNGSTDRARDPRFPFDLAERHAMWKASIPSELHCRVSILGQRDIGNAARWASAIDAQVVDMAVCAGFDPDEMDFVVFSRGKGKGSSYLDDFPGYELVELPSFEAPDPKRMRGTMPETLDASDVREGLFETGLTPLEDAWMDRVLTAVTPGVRDILRKFVRGAEFPRLQEEHRRAKATARMWKVRETREDDGVPFAINFTAVDAIVVHGNKILMHRRDVSPGKDMWALPGVMLRNDETVTDAAIRAVTDKTGIDVTAGDLRRAIVDQWFVDTLKRSVRERTITFPVLIQLGLGRPGANVSRAKARALPRTKGTDRVAWFTPDEIEGMRSSIHEDHAVIVDQALQRLRRRF
jgi:bifunctional NMN adenylyltransferase/nudix hydrolase